MVLRTDDDFVGPMENWRYAQTDGRCFRIAGPMIDVVSVKPMGGYTLRVAFSDGSFGVHDFSSTAARDGEMVRPLKPGRSACQA